MDILRQSYLRRTADGQLLLQNPHRSLAAESNQPHVGTISILPDEILSEILSYVPPRIKANLSERENDNETFPLTLVCKKWQRAYGPTLFRTITTQYSYGKKLCRSRALLELLNVRPHLKCYPRELRITTAGTTAHAALYRIVTAIIKCCPGLRQVCFCSMYTAEASKALSAISTLPRLESLNLAGPSLQLFFGTFTLPSLRNLTLSYYGPGRTPEDDAAVLGHGEPISITQSQLEQLFPVSKYHTGNVTTMSLPLPACHPNVTEHILRWPSALTDFSISFQQSIVQKHYTVPAMQRILDIQRSSLKRITLGILWGSLNRNVGCPDFSLFPHLETLSISSYNLIRSETPVDAARNLSAPSLRCLTLSFRTEDQDGAQLCVPHGGCEEDEGICESEGELSGRRVGENGN